MTIFKGIFYSYGFCKSFIYITYMFSKKPAVYFSADTRLEHSSSSVGLTCKQ